MKGRLTVSPAFIFRKSNNFVSALDTSINTDVQSIFKTWGENTSIQYTNWYNEKYPNNKIYIVRVDIKSGLFLQDTIQIDEVNKLVLEESISTLKKDTFLNKFDKERFNFDDKDRSWIWNA